MSRRGSSSHMVGAPRDVALTARTRALWLAGAVLMGLLSQWCMAFGPCATGPIGL